MSGKPKYFIGFRSERKEILSLGPKANNGALQFYWKCLLCDATYGPSTGTAIFKSEYSKCCQRRLEEKSNYLGYKELTGSKLTQIKNSASRRGLEYSVTPVYLWQIWEAQKGLCAYTGLKIFHGKDASLDRIDSTQGYIEGNVQWIAWKINRMKLNIPHKEFIELCSLIASRKGLNHG